MTPRFPRVVSLQMKTDGEAPSARFGALNLVRREGASQGGRSRWCIKIPMGEGKNSRRGRNS